jgi:4-amino-4-deoxy-L-arabinose transferase-like glycosyltransferase
MNPAVPVTRIRMLWGSAGAEFDRKGPLYCHAKRSIRCPVAPYLLAQDRRAGLALLAVLMIALTLLRLIVRGGLGIDLHYDEAQYAVWSFSPDWGYYSKPPLVAWAIGASRAFCGDTAFCVRLPSAIAFTLTPLLVYGIGRELWPRDERIALLGAGLFAMSPLVGFYSMFMTTDSLLLMCWATALLTLLLAIRRGGSWWLALGISLGLGLLAKYTMGIFAVSTALALIAIPRLRLFLFTPGPWMALYAATLLFAPNIWWNAANGFPTFHHTAEISQLDRAGAGLAGLIEFLAAQVVVFGPVAFFAAALAVRRGWVADRALADVGPGEVVRIPPLRFLICFSLPFLAIIAVQAGLSRAFANWAAPTYVGASLLAGYAMLATRMRWLIATSLVTAALMTILVYGHEAAARAIGWRLVSPLSTLRGWATLGDRIEALALQHGALLVVDERTLASELGFYAGSAGRGLLLWNPERQRNDHFRLTRDLIDARVARGPFLIISRHDIEPGLTAAFAEVTPLDTGLAMPAKRHPQALHCWLTRDFIGYP